MRRLPDRARARVGRLSFAYKLTLSSIAVTVLALTTASGVLLISDLRSSRARLVLDASVLADAVATTTTADLAFDDERGAVSRLHGFSAEPHVIRAATLRADGRPFAVFERTPLRDPAPGVPLPPIDVTAAAAFSADRLRIVRPVVLDGDRVGFVYVEFDLDGLHARTNRFIRLLLLVTVGSAVIAFGLGIPVQRALSRPILQLTEVTRAVRRDGRYDLRAPPGSEDEVGELIDGFNAMLDDVQRRDQRLLKHGETLERTVEDRTAELWHANDELTVARDRAVDASRTKNEFLTNISHEIRTPINGLLGMLSMLNDTPLTAEQAQYAAFAGQSASALLVLVNEVLDLSRIEGGQMMVHAAPFDLSAAIGEATAPQFVTARRKGLVATLDIGTDVPRLVIADAQRVGQIVTHLLENAIKFTNDGSIAVRVRIAPPSASAGQRVRVEVQDTGIGIAADKLFEVFETFTQVDGSMTRKFGGTGLGLTICRALLHLMGGEIGVDSELGHGSRFWFELPAPIRAAADGSAVPRVLVVDDHAIGQLSARRQLEKAGCAVDVVTSADEALGRSGEQPYGAIFVDCAGVRIDGFALADRLRARDGARARPIVAMITRATEDDRTRCREAGFDACLGCPLQLREVRAVVGQLFGNTGQAAESPVTPAGALSLR